MSTTFDEIRPIVEGRLYEWGRLVSEQPVPSISGAYEPDHVPGQALGHHGSSQPEAWVERFSEAMKVAQVIQNTLERLPSDQRAVVELRYKSRKPWGEIGKLIHASRRTAYRLRDEALLVLAWELGLLDNSFPKDEPIPGEQGDDPKGSKPPVRRPQGAP